MCKFKESKKQILKCLRDGNVMHASRVDIDIKNLLAIGDISVEDVAEIIKHARGGDYGSSPHHFDKNITVHLIKTRYRLASWYIKWFFIEPDVVFISVHQ